MKPLLVIIVLLACNSHLLHAQDSGFEQTVNFIQQKVSCCSVPYSSSTKRRVDSISIANNGDITIRHSDNKRQQTFNLFELHKESEGATGIDTIMGGKFIQFYVSAKKARLIRFATAVDAQETYTALLRLFTLCKNERKMFSDLNFAQTLDVINSRLAKWVEKGIIVTISAWENGDVRISNNRNTHFGFNFFDLAGSSHNNGIDEYGIEIVSCDVKAHAPLAWINFYTAQGKAAFIRLDCYIPPAELAIIRSAFLHLKSLCTKRDASNNHSAGATHFVSRNAVLKTGNEMLAASIRAADKKDEGDTTIAINSNGEGWLDNDSLPTGKWNFYAKDKLGKEYLFKSGTYHCTKAEIFEVINIDSSDLAKDYHLSFNSLQQGQVKSIPFIKTAAWDYYHSTGKLWKSVLYKYRQIPIHTAIVITGPEPNAPTRLTVQLKENPDEWVEGDVKEYDADGNLYKKLQYYGFNEVYNKTLYDKSGKVIKTETAKRYEKEISPVNY